MSHMKSPNKSLYETYDLIDLCYCNKVMPHIEWRLVSRTRLSNKNLTGINKLE